MKWTDDRLKTLYAEGLAAGESDPPCPDEAVLAGKQDHGLAGLGPVVVAEADSVVGDRGTGVLLRPCASS